MWENNVDKANPLPAGGDRERRKKETWKAIILTLIQEASTFEYEFLICYQQAKWAERYFSSELWNAITWGSGPHFRFHIWRGVLPPKWKGHLPTCLAKAAGVLQIMGVLGREPAWCWGSGDGKSGPTLLQAACLAWSHLKLRYLSFLIW